MIHWPNPIGGASRRASWLNRLLEAARSRVLKGVTGGKLIPHTDGQWLVIDPSGTGGGDGWNFKGDYDPEKQYAGNRDAVYVAADSPAVDGTGLVDVTTGAEADTATPGFWLCLKSPRVKVGDVTTVHLPYWANPAHGQVKDAFWIPFFTNICG